jgi:hypothetical protein
METQKSCKKTKAQFFHIWKFLAIAKVQKNVKCKSFLNEKSYGIPLLRRLKSKTRFAWKHKKVSEKQGPIFPHLEILATNFPSFKNEKM